MELPTSLPKGPCIVCLDTRISNCAGTMRVCMPRALNMTPRKWLRILNCYSTIRHSLVVPNLPLQDLLVPTPPPAVGHGARGPGCCPDNTEWLVEGQKDLHTLSVGLMDGHTRSHFCIDGARKGHTSLCPSQRENHPLNCCGSAIEAPVSHHPAPNNVMSPASAHIISLWYRFTACNDLLFWSFSSHHT